MFTCQRVATRSYNTCNSFIIHSCHAWPYLNSSTLFSGLNSVLPTRKRMCNHPVSHLSAKISVDLGGRYYVKKRMCQSVEPKIVKWISGKEPKQTIIVDNSAAVKSFFYLFFFQVFLSVFVFHFRDITRISYFIFFFFVENSMLQWGLEPETTSTSGVPVLACTAVRTSYHITLSCDWQLICKSSSGRTF